jgi:outer membrane protein assembly factor BamE
MSPLRIVIVTHRLLPGGLLLGALLALAGGCVYRPNIQQGNLLKAEDVDQVTVGMTHSQVRFVLGTPMIADPFQPDRWDYIYTLQRGRNPRIDRAHYVVHFEGDKVSLIEKLTRPMAPLDPSGKGSGADGAEREPPPLPSISQPQPDARRPGGN